MFSNTATPKYYAAFREKVQSGEIPVNYHILQEMDRIEDVERLKGAELLIPREDAYELEEGEYFIPDLLGLKVTADDGRELGEIKDVIETGANNVYDVRGDGGKSILIPAIPDYILDVNLEEGTMTVHLLPGLENL